MEIRWLSQLENEDIEEFGAKAVKLSLLSKRNIPVSQGFTLSSDFFDEFLRESKVFDFLNQKIMTVSSEKDASKLSKDIRTFIQMSAFPEGSLSKILGFYHAIDVTANPENSTADKLLNSKSNPLVVLRLSSRPEDRHIDFPAIRNIKGGKEIQAALLEAFSFIFSSQTIIEISKSRSLPRIALIFQQMVNSKKSGFCHFKKGKPIEIFSTFGLVDSIKKGEVYPDMFKVDSGNFKILSRQIHKKEIAYYNDLFQNKIKEVSVAEDDTKDPSLTHDEVNELYEIANKLSIILKTDFDFEWAFDTKGLKIINYEVKHMAEKDVFDVIFEEDDGQETHEEEETNQEQTNQGTNEGGNTEGREVQSNSENNTGQPQPSSPEGSQEQEPEKNEESSLEIDNIGAAFDKIREKYAKINPNLKDILALYKEDVLDELRRGGS
jgi:phosphoenolpyruvate synthase/pyruvate phosphate dikinase